MLAFSIPETDIKTFMNTLLREDTFDAFEVRNIEINSFTKFEITGAMDKDYFPEPETVPANPRRYCTWSELRPYVFNIIKGKLRPKSMKIVFSAGSEITATLHTNASALHLNMLFNGNEIVFTTATSQKSFSLDRNVDNAWEDYVKRFFADKNIPVMAD